MIFRLAYAALLLLLPSHGQTATLGHPYAQALTGFFQALPPHLGSVAATYLTAPNAQSPVELRALLGAAQAAPAAMPPQAEPTRFIAETPANPLEAARRLAVLHAALTPLLADKAALESLDSAYVLARDRLERSQRAELDASLRSLAEALIPRKSGDEAVISQSRELPHPLHEAAKLRDFHDYRTSMDESMLTKMKAIEPWVPVRPGAVIVDMGTGTGTLAARLARKHPGVKVIGVDLSPQMIELAKAHNDPLPNLSWAIGAAAQPAARDADAAIFSSVAHEIYSYGGDSMQEVAKALEAAARGLAPGGRLIIRDFVRPAQGSKGVHLRHRKSDIVPGHGFEDFSRDFGRPVPVRKVAESEDDVVYETDLASAYEFLYRKDYHANWEVELKERYGFWTAREAKNLIESAGLRIVHYEERMNPWIQAHRFDGKVALLDPGTGDVLPAPNSQMLLIAEKPR